VNERVALVTGASRGIGRAVAARFEELGARVLAPSRSELDLANPASTEDYLSRLAQPIDILVNDAGINQLAGLGETDDGLLRSTLEINLLAPLRLARALVPAMAQRGWGRVVNISSVWAVVAKERRLPYIVSKTGLNGFTRALAVEFGSRGVLVNAVAPGFVMTEMTTQNNSPEELEAIAQGIPMRRMAQPQEIAELVAFLASSRNSFMTGQVVVCDGGYSVV
jgi:NAD(P)-dependent dehydrogenase (short-subunit alcohol dehydrogenase family)